MRPGSAIPDIPGIFSLCVFCSPKVSCLIKHVIKLVPNLNSVKNKFTNNENGNEGEPFLLITCVHNTLTRTGKKGSHLR